MNNGNTVKAVRATITLGDFSLDMFQLEDYSYRMSATQVTSTLGKHAKSIWEFLEGNSPQAAPYKGFSLGKIKAEGVKNVISEVTLEIASAYWMYWAFKGNELAQALSMACMAEALERRADNAFGILRTEQERNDRFEARMKGKVTRRTLTDAIQDYLERHPEKSANYRKFIYSNCSDCLNKFILGVKSTQAKEFYQIPKDSLLRNHVPTEALRELDFAENMATRFIDKDHEPLQAVKDALEIAHVKFIGLD